MRKAAPFFFALTALLLVASSTPALADEPPFEWAMPARFGAERDEQGLIRYAGSAAQFKAEESRAGGFAVTLTLRHDLCKKDATYTWRSVAGKVSDRGGAGCRVTQHFPEEGSYPVAVRVRFPGGRTLVFTRTVEVRDWLIVSIGDSVASGEGNPEVSGNIHRAKWQSSRCHRSINAGPAQAALKLEEADPKTSVTFVHLACSGAKLTSGLLHGYEGIDPGKSPEPPLLSPQLDELELIASQRHVDAVLVSVGANDVYFGPIVGFCLAKRNCQERRFDPKDPEHPAPNPPLFLPEVVTEALGRLKEEYTTLATRLSPIVSAEDVLIVDYFDPTRDSNGEFCKRIGVPLPRGFLQIDRSEARWAATFLLARLNKEIREAADAAGWTEVKGVAEAFRTHGYCAKDSWIRHIVRAAVRQHGLSLKSRQSGAFHPNEKGHQEEAKLIKPFLDRVLYHGQPPPEENGTVVFVDQDGNRTQSSDEGLLERDVWIALIVLLPSALVGAVLIARALGRSPDREEIDFCVPLPPKPAKWPHRASVEAFGALVEDPARWVHRRVESIEIIDADLFRRRTSVDFTPTTPAGLPSPTHAPIALLAKRVLSRFDLRDEAGGAVPLATSDENAAFAAAHLLAIAAEVTGEPPSERLEELCWRVARGDQPAALEAMGKIATEVEPEEARQALGGSERFRNTLKTYALGFAVVVKVGDPSRRVLKFAYDYPAETDLELRHYLGLDAAPFTFFIPELGDAASRHFEFIRVEGLEVLDFKLLGQRPDGSLIPRRRSGKGNEAHITVTRIPLRTQGVASVSLRATRTGILRGGPLVAALAAAALTAAWFALPALATNSSGAASILLAVPAAFGAYLGSRRPHPLEAAMLSGARALVFASGALAFLGAAVLTLDSSVEFLRIFLGTIALLSWLPAIGLLIAYLRPVSPTRNNSDCLL